jgi:hypothetical protein
VKEENATLFYAAVRRIGLLEATAGALAIELDKLAVPDAKALRETYAELDAAFRKAIQTEINRLAST